MGNHSAGRAVVQTIESMLKRRLPSDTALGMLDEACEPHRGCDIEWDDDCNQETPLGKLITEAFGKPEAVYVEDDDNSEWYDGPYSLFNARYDFC